MRSPPVRSIPVLPSQEEFAYTLRLVAEVLASNGSTSMASVCSGSLALMDAGVPIKAAVAGIAMGLVFAEGKYTTLTDILGAEDAFGDMDFKVAGTVRRDHRAAARHEDRRHPRRRARSPRSSRPRKPACRSSTNMNAAIAAPRAEVAATAPKIVSITIPMDKIGEVIGPKGKVINTIQQETGADIAVDDDGSVGIVTIGCGRRPAKMEEARPRILAIVDPPKADVGAIYMGRVVNITKFGAFVNILPGRDGLVHISKLGRGKRINSVEDVLQLGQEIEVVVEEIDDKGKVSLTPSAALDGAGGGGDGGDARRRGDRGDRRASAARSEPAAHAAAPTQRRPTSRPCRSRTLRRTSSPASSATSVPAAKPAATTAAATVAASRRPWRPAAAWRRPRSRPASSPLTVGRPSTADARPRERSARHATRQRA